MAPVNNLRLARIENGRGNNEPFPPRQDDANERAKRNNGKPRCKLLKQGHTERGTDRPVTGQPDDGRIQPRTLAAHIEIAALRETKHAFPVRARVRSEVESGLPAVEQLDPQPATDQQRGQTPDENLAKRVTVSRRGHTT